MKNNDLKFLLYPKKEPEAVNTIKIKKNHLYFHSHPTKHISNLITVQICCHWILFSFISWCKNNNSLNFYWQSDNRNMKINKILSQCRQLSFPSLIFKFIQKISNNNRWENNKDKRHFMMFYTNLLKKILSKKD